MTHQPEIEELLGHLINAPHHCSEAISLRDAIATEVREQVRTVTLVPAEGRRVIDITSEVADVLATRVEDFERLHDGHHAAAIAERITERMRDDEGGTHDHEG